MFTTCENKYSKFYGFINISKTVYVWSQLQKIKKNLGTLKKEMAKLTVLLRNVFLYTFSIVHTNLQILSFSMDFVRPEKYINIIIQKLTYY